MAYLLSYADKLRWRKHVEGLAIKNEMKYFWLRSVLKSDKRWEDSFSLGPLVLELMINATDGFRSIRKVAKNHY